MLAVALAGLFLGSVRTADGSTELTTYPAAQIRAGFTLPAQDMYFLLAEQLTGHASVKPFTTEEYYILPSFLENSIDPDSVVQYETSTIGIAVDVKCDLVPANKITLGCDNPGCAGTLSTKLDQISNFSVVVDDSC